MRFHEQTMCAQRSSENQQRGHEPSCRVCQTPSSKQRKIESPTRRNKIFLIYSLHGVPFLRHRTQNLLKLVVGTR